MNYSSPLTTDSTGMVFINPLSDYPNYYRLREPAWFQQQYRIPYVAGIDPYVTLMPEETMKELRASTFNRNKFSDLKLSEL